MIPYIILSVSVGLLFLLSFLLLPLGTFIFGALGAMFALLGVFLINHVLYPKMYPVTLRIFGERLGSLTITDNIKTRVIKDKNGYEYLQSAGGKKWKMPDRKYLMKSDKGVFADIFDTQSQQFPITINTENMEEVKKMIIPEDQRVWFAKTVIPEIKEITQPPKDRLQQILVIGSILGVILLLTVTMIFYPQYAVEMDQIAKARESKLAQDWLDLQTIYKQGVIVCEFPDSGKKTEVEVPIAPPT